MQFCVHESGSQQCLLNAMETQNPLCCLTFPRTEPQDRPGRRSCRLVSHVAAPRGVSFASAIRRARRRIRGASREGPRMSHWTCGGPYGLWPIGRCDSGTKCLESTNACTQIYRVSDKTSMRLCYRRAAASCKWGSSVCPDIVPTLSSSFGLPIGKMPWYQIIHRDFQSWHIYRTSFRCTGSFSHSV